MLTNKINGKKYVGRTSRTLEIRWQGHVSAARRNDSDMLIARAISKHGPDAFERSILEECSDDIIAEREQYWILEQKSYVSDGGYNLTYGGDGGLLGYKFSEEACEKMRQKALGRKHSEEAKKKMSEAAQDRVVSPETIEKRAKANRGQKRTDEQRKRMSDAQCKRMSEHPHSEETKKKISETCKLCGPVSEETRNKLSLSSSGRRHTEETKAKMRLQHCKPILQFDLEDNLVREYISIKDAASQSSVSIVSIHRGLRSGKPKCGYYWKYKEIT